MIKSEDTKVLWILIPVVLAVLFALFVALKRWKSRENKTTGGLQAQSGKFDLPPPLHRGERMVARQTGIASYYASSQSFPNKYTKKQELAQYPAVRTPPKAIANNPRSSPSNLRV